MIFGLSPEEFAILDELCLRDLKSRGAKLWIFGSRARGDHGPHSDIDILVDGGESVSQLDIAIVQDKLIESRLPYKVDLVELKDLAKSYLPQVLKDRVEV